MNRLLAVPAGESSDGWDERALGPDSPSVSAQQSHERKCCIREMERVFSCKTPDIEIVQDSNETEDEKDGYRVRRCPQRVFANKSDSAGALCITL
jgi:hypothetical protein